jgi:hypothetical protein
VHRSEVFDQGLAGFVVQFFEGGGGDGDRVLFGSGLQVAGAFAENAEDDLAHRMDISFCPPPSLAIRSAAKGQLEYGEPILGAPMAPGRWVPSSCRSRRRGLNRKGLEEGEGGPEADQGCDEPCGAGSGWRHGARRLSA